MTARNGKTAIASTVFVDIVGYSRARIAPQTAMKVRLNEIVGKAIGNVPEGDRIIVDALEDAGRAVEFFNETLDQLVQKLFEQRAFKLTFVLRQHLTDLLLADEAFLH